MSVDTERLEGGKVKLLSGANLIWILGAALFCLALGIRAWYSSNIPFPRPVDACYYYSVAENLYNGRGFVIDYAWNYLRGVPDSLPIPSSSYWQPFTSIILFLFFKVAGPSWSHAQFVAAIFGSFMVVLGFLFALRMFGNVWLSLLPGLLLVAQPDMLLLSSSCDTRAFSGVFVGSALFTLIPALGKSPRWFLLTGILSGLAFLTRSDGVLAVIIATIVGLWYRKREHAVPARYLLWMWAFFLICISPWLVRNYLTFGTPLPGSFMKTVFLVSYTDLFTSQPEKLNPRYFLDAGLLYHLYLRQLTLGHNLAIIMKVFGWPLFFLGITEMFAGMRRPTHIPFLLYFLIIYSTTALILTLVCLRGTFGHMLPPLMPFMPVFAFLALARFWKFIRLEKWLSFTWLALLFFAAMGFFYVKVTLHIRPELQQHSTQIQQLQENIHKWLEDEAYRGPIITDDTWSYNRATGDKAYMLPFDPYERIKEVARKLKTEYLVFRIGIHDRLPDFNQTAIEDLNIVFRDIVFAAPISEVRQLFERGRGQGKAKSEPLPGQEAFEEKPLPPAVQILQFLDPEITGQRISLKELGRIHHEAGIILSDKYGFHESAAVEFKKAVLCAPQVPDTHRNLGEALYRAGKYEEALESLKKAHSMAPKREDIIGVLRKCEKALEQVP